VGSLWRLARTARQHISWRLLLLAAGVSAALAWPGVPVAGSRGYWWALDHGSARWALVGAVVTLCLAWRHRYPLQAWAVVTAAAACLLLAWHAHVAAGTMTAAGASPQGARTGLGLIALLAPPLIALYAAAANCSRRRGRAALLLSVVAFGAALARDITTPGSGADPWPAGAEIALLILGAIVVAWALGERAGASGAAVTALAERAVAVEEGRAAREQAAAAAERSRIAGELHDIIAHHISVVAVQAGAARTLADSGAQPDIDLLRGIETASRQALTEIRQTLGVIRGSSDGPAPQPTTAHLPALAGQMARAGLAVSIEGSAGPLPCYVDLSVYRIVQEALTNVLRHSAARAALVRFRRLSGELEVSVTDSGPARERSRAANPAEPDGPGGYGLIGLRERARQLGGQLEAGTCPDGGFKVRALLTVPDAKPTADHDQQRLGTKPADLPAGAAT
jgi:signal transduction histidine kinase